MAAAMAETLGTDILTKLGAYWIEVDYLKEQLGEKAASVFNKFVGLHDYYFKAGKLKKIRGKVGFPTNLEKMAKTCKCSERTVWSHVQKIMKAGFLEREDRGRRDPIYILTDKFWNLPDQYRKEKQAEAAAAAAEAERQKQAELQADDWMDAYRAAITGEWSGGQVEESDPVQTETEEVIHTEESQESQVEDAGLANVSGMARKSCDTILLPGITTNRLDDEIYYGARARTNTKSQKMSQEKIEAKRKLFADGLDALAEKLRDALLWTDDEIRKTQDYLLAHTRWPGFFVDAAADHAIAQLHTALGSDEHYLATCFANAIKTHLNAERAAEYTANRRAQDRLERDAESGPRRKFEQYNWLEIRPEDPQQKRPEEYAV